MMTDQDLIYNLTLFLVQNLFLVQHTGNKKYFYIICNHLLCHYFFDGKLIQFTAERLCHHFVFVFLLREQRRKKKKKKYKLLMMKKKMMMKKNADSMKNICILYVLYPVIVCN